MLSVSHLQAKRATLTAQVEQHVGQINRINGAVAQLDELIGELESEREEAEPSVWDDPCWSVRDANAALKHIAVDDAAPTAPSMTPPSPPEMFTRFAPCVGCASEACDLNQQCEFVS